MGKAVPIVYLSSDHAGVELRLAIAGHLVACGLSISDLGPDAGDAVDYPDAAETLALAMRENPLARGVVVCGSGIGISIAANRFPWVRAALVGDATAARLCRQHNDANVIAFGQRLTGVTVALDCVDRFMETEFEGGRHVRRVAKLSQPDGMA